MIRPLRQKNLSKAFYDQLEEVHQKMAEASLRGRYDYYHESSFIFYYRKLEEPLSINDYGR